MAEATQLTVGEIQRGASALLSEHRNAVLTYLGVFSSLTAIGNYLDEVAGTGDPDVVAGQLAYSNGLFGLVLLLPSIIGQYFLIERMLWDRRDDRPFVLGRVLGFIGLAIVSYLGVIFATLFFIIPGLFVGARWFMCIGFYVGEGRGVFSSLGTSWERARGNTTAIALSIFVLLILLAVASAVISAISGTAYGTGNSGFLSYVLNAILSEVFAVALIAMSIATYQRLGNRNQQLAETFA